MSAVNIQLSAMGLSSLLRKLNCQCERCCECGGSGRGVSAGWTCDECCGRGILGEACCRCELLVCLASLEEGTD